MLRLLEKIRLFEAKGKGWDRSRFWNRHYFGAVLKSRWTGRRRSLPHNGKHGRLFVRISKGSRIWTVTISGQRRRGKIRQIVAKKHTVLETSLSRKNTNPLSTKADFLEGRGTILFSCVAKTQSCFRTRAGGMQGKKDGSARKWKLCTQDNQNLTERNKRHMKTNPIVAFVIRELYFESNWQNPMGFCSWKLLLFRTARADGRTEEWASSSNFSSPFTAAEFHFGSLQIWCPQTFRTF